MALAQICMSAHSCIELHLNAENGTQGQHWVLGLREKTLGQPRENRENATIAGQGLVGHLQGRHENQETGYIKFEEWPKPGHTSDVAVVATIKQPQQQLKQKKGRKTAPLPPATLFMAAHKTAAATEATAATATAATWSCSSSNFFQLPATISISVNMQST